MNMQQECVSAESASMDFLIGSQDLNLYTQDLLKATLNSIKTSNRIPASGEKFKFFNSFPGFRQLMKTEQRKILDLMARILQHQGVKGTFERLEVEEKFDFLVDANDSILERTGTALDEASGIKKKDEAVVTTIKFVQPINTSWNKKMSSSNSLISLLAAKNVQRPQLKFSKKINNSNTPFEPIIKYKPNSIKPLSILLEINEDGHQMFSHPYEIEIEKFQPPDCNLQKVIPKTPKSFENTPYEFIDTVSGLTNLCKDLSEEKEVAVDLEAHSYRTFQGFTCLMQISTRTKDYLVDVLELRDHMHLINEIFTKPTILKVFHGADMDVVWLQRDFGVYLVNLFDTGQAARVLNYAHYSLAYLLKRFCQVEPDKSFQLADWRIRPLTDKMIHYAREDTHHLLYVHDCLKNELLDQGNEQKNLLKSVFQRSKLISLKRYEKFLINEDSYISLYHRSKKSFNVRQLFALKEFYMWRDKMARTEDESYGYVLPNHMMLQIAEILPREQQGILACCNPIPPLVRQQLNELHLIILRARESAEEKLLVPQSHLKLSASQSQLRRETALCCPHDLLLQQETVFPTTLDDGFGAKVTKCAIVKPTPDLLAFATLENDDQSHFVDRRLKNVKMLLDKIISPFQRFLLLENSIVSDESDVISTSNAQDFERVERIHQHLQNLASAPVCLSTPSEEQEKVDAGSPVSTGPSTTVDKVQDCTALRDQSPRKRKHKSKRPVFGTPLASFSPMEKNPLAPKAFTSFDYKNSSYTIDQRNNQNAKKRNFNPNDCSLPEKDRKRTKRNRSGKNITYGSKFKNWKKKQCPNS